MAQNETQPEEFAAIYMVSDLSRGMIAWDGQNDTQNPRNFSSARKWTIMVLFSAIIVLTNLATSIVAPAAPTIISEFDIASPILASMITTISVLAFLFGPLILSPLSELYGRRPIFNFANAVFSLSNIGLALAPNIGVFIAFRVINGMGGSVGLSIGGGIIADIFDIHQRGVPNALVAMGSLFGPVLGPLFGGIITQYVGWRWIFWMILIFSASVTIAMGLLVPETNPSVIIQQKITKLGRKLRRDDLQNALLPLRNPAALQSTWFRLAHAVSRPLKMLFRSPIMAVISLMVGLISGLLYTLLTTTSNLFENVYNWSLAAAGLAYMGLGSGSLVALILFAKTSDRITMHLTKKNQNTFEPEMRMATAFLPALFMPISFFWYGWSVYAGTHWIVPLIGLFPFGFAQVGLHATAQAYLIDASGPFAASSIAGVTAVRCLFGTFLPLAAPSLYDTLGLGWGNSLLGLSSLVMLGLALVIYRFGKNLRERYPLIME